jgi:hypothetical protein
MTTVLIVRSVKASTIPERRSALCLQILPLMIPSHSTLPILFHSCHCHGLLLVNMPYVSPLKVPPPSLSSSPSRTFVPSPSVPLSPVYTPPSSPPGDSELTAPNFPTRRTKPLDIPRHVNDIPNHSYPVSLPSPRCAYDHRNPPIEILRHGKHAQQSSNQNQNQNQNQTQSSSKSSKAQPAAPQQTQPPQQQYQPPQQQAYYDNTMPAQGLSANQGKSLVAQYWSR